MRLHFFSSSFSNVSSYLVALIGIVFFVNPVYAVINSLELIDQESVPVSIIGKAYDQKTGQHIYSEHHFFSENNYLISYRSPENKEIVSMDLDNAISPFSPDFQQLDRRTGVKIYSQRIDNNLVMGKNENGEKKEATKEIKEPLVVGPGFEPFVRNEWEKLATGEAVVFRLAVPANQRVHKMQAYAVPLEECIKRIRERSDLNELDENPLDAISEGHACFSMKSTNWLANRIIKPIYIIYDNQRRLSLYSGLSNLTDDNGKWQTVYIYYNYLSQLTQN